MHFRASAHTEVGRSQNSELCAVGATECSKRQFLNPLACSANVSGGHQDQEWLCRPIDDPPSRSGRCSCVLWVNDYRRCVV